MIFTHADLRCADRLDDKQGGDTIVTMERVKEAKAFDAELADKSTVMCVAHIGAYGLSLETERRGRAEESAQDLDSSQRARDYLVAHHLAPAITNFILDENRSCCGMEFEKKRMIMYGEWSNLPRDRALEAKFNTSSTDRQQPRANQPKWFGVHA